MTDLKEIFDEWQNNIKFREDFKQDPDQALKNAGFEVSADDLVKIKAMLNLKDKIIEELDKRISK